MRVNEFKLSLASVPFLLVLGMGACVALTGFVSYKLGDAALAGVTQPENNPTQKLLSQPNKGETEQKMVDFQPLNLAKVAKETRLYIQNQQKIAAKRDKDADKSEKQASDDKTETQSGKQPQL